MASALPSSAEELEEKLLICQICFDAFNSKTLKPLILPCHHSFCFKCLDDLGRHGGFPCPLCRTPIPFKVNEPASRQFKVDHTRMTLIDWAQTAKRGEGTPQTPPVQSEEMCEKHGDEKIKYFCRRCRKPVCPSCVIKEHKEHDVAEVEVVCGSAKSQLLSACLEMDKRIGSVQQTARAARVGLQGLGSQEKATLGEMEEAFSRLVSYILESKTTAMEDFRAQVKQDRLRLEDFVASQESLLAAALSTVDFGRREASLGSASSVVVSLDQVMTFLADLSARQAETPIRQPDYQVNTREMARITEAIAYFGHVETENASEGDSPGSRGDNSRATEKTSGLSTAAAATASSSPLTSSRGELVEPLPPSTSRPQDCRAVDLQAVSAAAAEAAATAATAVRDVGGSQVFHCPKITLDVSRCSKDCSLNSERTCLIRLPQPFGLPSSREKLAQADPPYRFPGARGIEALTGAAYFEVKVTATPSPEVGNKGPWAEVGVASQSALEAREGSERTTGSASHTALTVTLGRQGNAVNARAFCCHHHLGVRNLTRFCPQSSTSVALGCLWDVARGRVFIIDAMEIRLLFKGDLSTGEPLYPLCSVQSVDKCGVEVTLQLLASRHVEMPLEKRWFLEHLLSKSCVVM